MIRCMNCANLVNQGEILMCDDCGCQYCIDCGCPNCSKPQSEHNQFYCDCPECENDRKERRPVLDDNGKELF